MFDRSWIVLGIGALSIGLIFAALGFPWWAAGIVAGIWGAFSRPITKLIFPSWKSNQTFE